MTDANLTLCLLVGVLFAAGAYLVLARSLLRVVVGFVLLGHGANLVLLVAGGPAGEAPVSGSTALEDASDPLPQAMAVTAVVITFAVTALLLALTHRSQVLLGHDRVPEGAPGADPDLRAETEGGAS